MTCSCTTPRRGRSSAARSSPPSRPAGCARRGRPVVHLRLQPGRLRGRRADPRRPARPGAVRRVGRHRGHRPRRHDRAAPARGAGQLRRGGGARPEESAGRRPGLDRGRRRQARHRPSRGARGAGARPPAPPTGCRTRSRTGSPTTSPARVSCSPSRSPCSPCWTRSPPPTPASTSASQAPDAVLADPTLLQHLLVNLIGNAVKYTQPGERPSVTVRSFSGGDRGWVRLYVVDAGIGIPPGEEATDLRAVPPGLDGAGHLRGLRSRTGAVQAHRAPPRRPDQRPAQRGPRDHDHRDAPAGPRPSARGTGQRFAP